MFALLEDGGEQIIISLILAFVYSIDWQYLNLNDGLLAK